jgi:hypothetical protein
MRHRIERRAPAAPGERDLRIAAGHQKWERGPVEPAGLALVASQSFEVRLVRQPPQQMIQAVGRAAEYVARLARGGVARAAAQNQSRVGNLAGNEGSRQIGAAGGIVRPAVLRPPHKYIAGDWAFEACHETARFCQMRDRHAVHRAVLQRLRAARDAANADDAFERGDRDTQARCALDSRGQAFAVLCEISALGRDEQRVEVALQSGSPGISFSASRPAIHIAMLRRRARNAVGRQALSSEQDLHGATAGGGGVAPASNRARTSAATVSVRRRSASSKTTSARRRDWP